MLVLGGRTSGQIFPAALLPPEVELVVMTEDGSQGRRGLATEAFVEHLEWCDQAFACGPTAMFRAMADVMRNARALRPVQALLEEGMGCGTGICYGCAVKTRKGMRLVCKDGPMFDLRDVFP
jgi:dihydroorotate dehydrogenase electron transfer subunit